MGVAMLYNPQSPIRARASVIIIHHAASDASEPIPSLEGLGDLELDDDAKASFLGGNAARVFGINQ
jgi:hypothetical protein